MLATLISQLVDFLQTHSRLAYGVVFVLAMSESLPVIGAIVPGTAVILALSALVPSGVLVVWPLLAAATLGAIAGDGFAFWLGHRYHATIRSSWPFSRYPLAIQTSELFFEKYGMRSIFLARFVPGVRAFVPLLAGTLGMHVARFYAVNVLSAAVWAPAHILPGMLFGVTIHTLGPAAKPLGALLFTLVVLSWLFAHVLRYALRKGLPYFRASVEILLEKLSERSDRVSRFFVQLMDPASSELRLIILLILIVTAGTWLFFGILEDVYSGDPLVLADHAVYQLLQGFRSYPSDIVMVTITELGDTAIVIAISVALIAYFLWAQAKHTLIFFVGSVAGASAVNTAIKVAMHRSRPVDGLYTGWSAFSFPSGHSTVNMAMCGAIAFLIVQHSKGRLAVTAPLVAGIAVLAIAFSRLYLGAHWFSDVTAGMAFGLTWLTLLAATFIRRPMEQLNPSVLAFLPIFILGTFGSWHVVDRHAADMTRYAARNEPPLVELSNWWSSEQTMVGTRRVDLTGDLEERFSVEWAGDIAPLQRALINLGWQAPTTWSLRSIGALAVGASPASAIPPVPLLASGRLPELVLLYDESDENTRIVLRFWRESIQVKGRTVMPVWKATITREEIRRPWDLFSFPVEKGDGADVGVPLVVESLKSMRAAFSISDNTVRAVLQMQPYGRRS